MKIKNERQIRPLRKYEVFTRQYTLDGHEEQSETFTADDMVRDEDSLIFYSTGNPIRFYVGQPLPHKIIVTPVEDAELPQ